MITTFLKNSKVWKVVGFILIVVGLFMHDQMQRTHMAKLESDLAVSVQNEEALQNSLRAERIKSEQLKWDSDNKDRLIDHLRKDRDRWMEDYTQTHEDLNTLLYSLPDLTTPEQVEEAKKEVQSTLLNSYRCIEAATGGSQCD